MKYDGPINVASGMSAKSKVWKNETWQWSTLVNRLLEENRTNETYKEFINASKIDQSKIKDVGGYVGGYLRNGRRKPGNVVNRQLLTLDIDFAHLDFWVDLCLQFNNAAVLHATHKHNEASPRYRLVMPLDREVTPDEYVAIARKVAGLMGIDLFDNTTFETNRLMFWPSNPKDVEYYAEAQDGPWLDADRVLSTYADWKDSSLWPTADRNFEEVKTFSKKQEGPETKRGIIGAFCRAYTMTEVIDAYLKDSYVEAGKDRYTYLKGTAAAGLIVYEDKFAYSHHGTDPSGSKLCNAFDLVRVHLFGHLDGDAELAASKRASFKAMEDLARKDKKVKAVIATESITDSKYDFAEPIEDEDIDWASELEVDFKGKYLSSADNLNLIFTNDRRLKDTFKQNDFDGKRYVFRTLPWRKVLTPEPIKNVDYSGIRNYIESIYGIVGSLKVDDSLALEFQKQSFHPVRDYLKAQTWDEVKRVDTLLIDYFGAKDNLYTREAIRKTVVGAVARVFKPGVKFDLVITLVGEQGTGKSTFVSKLGGPWFSDTFMTVQGKEALEQIQGAWIIELAELSGLRKAEVEAVKHFISKQVDSFRAAYARTSETYYRQCIFFGTTNKKDFLSDPSGNRRFMPIDIDPTFATKDVFNIPESEIGQIWAEAVLMYYQGETLYLSRDAEVIAKKEQRQHSSTDERSGLVEAYVNTLLPSDWDKRNIYERRDYLSDPISPKGEVGRQYTCVAEVWCECLGKEKEDMSRYNTRDINEILRGLDGWEQSSSTKNFAIYGKQKYYLRI